ncbi:hypothetical protein [Rhizobium phaseoli]|uniref:hypothetical protein n=1 Tax=Rhizobium phaseoli TaxID=396 RepID=UPI001111B1B1|nr:hypothetical protein [Rhizobium phaseoli]
MAKTLESPKLFALLIQKREAMGSTQTELSIDGKLLTVQQNDMRAHSFRQQGAPVGLATSPVSGSTPGQSAVLLLVPDG